MTDEQITALALANGFHLTTQPDGMRAPQKHTLDVDWDTL